MSHVYRVEIPPGVSAEALLEAIQSDPHVEYAQPDHQVVLDTSSFFDDPYLSSTGSWGQPYADLWGLDFIRAPEAWSSAQGEGAVVAVVDTGLDLTHPDIADNVWVNPGEDLNGNDRADAFDRNGLDDDQNGFIDDLNGFDFAGSVDANGDGDYADPGDVSDADPTDDNGHGTHVTGTIAAVADNGLGIVGVAPRARVMALKGFPEEGSASDTVLWRAVLYAAENGATVINNSWSCGTACPTNPLAEDVLETVESLGALVVTSAGNDSTDVAFYSPENGNRVITVGAVGFDEELPGFSNRGWLVDVVAPGGGPETPGSIQVARQNILSLRAHGLRANEPAFLVDDDYLRLAGTSMASPHVAGAVAVLRALRPELTPADVRTLVRLSARDLGSAGVDPEFGAGALDLEALLDEPLPDFHLELTSPRAGALFAPEDSPIEIRGIASGADLASLEVTVASGLSGREFEPLESFGDSGVDWTGPSDAPTLLAHFDVAELADGPYVIRVHAVLDDGREYDDFALVGVERNSPLPISTGVRETATPELSAEKLVWQVLEPSTSELDDDLVLGRFPKPTKPSTRGGRQEGAASTRLSLAGDQRNPVRDESELAWTEVGENGTRILKRCRLVSNTRCVPRSVSAAPGNYSLPFLRGGWLVWSRTHQGANFIEGCPLGRGASGCMPRSLIDATTGSDWILHDFDGRTLLVGRPGILSRCRLDAKKGPCRPVDVRLPGDVSPIEPRHDGDLVAFSQIEVGSLLPPGCSIADPRAGCRLQIVALVQYRACFVDPITSICDPITISDQQPVERAFGVVPAGRRIVWSMGEADEQGALRFCELDPLERRCPMQRVGGTLASQLEPALEGNRLVWSDARDGGFAVMGLSLPELVGPGARSVQAGSSLSLSLEAVPDDSGTFRYELEGLSGLSPTAASARVVDSGTPGGRIQVQARIPSDATGTARWRIRAIGGGGLVSERVVDLEIRARR